jgi:hypothetical protein
MFGLFGRGKGYRHYSDGVEQSLSMLFGGFPNHILPSVRQGVDVEGIKRGLFRKKDTTPQECAVELARLIIGRAIAQMPQEQKNAALASFDSETGSHPVHVACGVMHEVAKQMADEP